MITPAQYNRISGAIPALRKADPGLAREFQGAAIYARIPAGRDVFSQGDPVESIALLLSGRVRVFKIGETGREITLYRFGAGESCILTANAILSQGNFPAIAVVEQEAEAVLIPADIFRGWVQRHELWRGFVFDLLSQRIASLMETIEEVAFQRMDRRVVSLLLEQCQRQNPVLITHQKIAAELGSSREVISRILENFANQGMIRSGRGEIEVLDRESLEMYLAM